MLENQITRVPCRRRNKESMPRAEKFGDLITADHKVLNEGSESQNNQRYARGTRYRHSVDTILSVWKQEFAEDGEESTKISGAVTKARSYFYTQFVRIWQILWRIIMESSNVYTLSLKNKRNCRTSFHDEWKREHQPYYWNPDWMISGGRILWNAIAICDMSRTSWQTGKLRMDEDLGNHSLDQSFHLVHWWNTSQIPKETKLEFINSVRKYYQVSFQDMLWSREEFGKETFWLLILKN